MRFPTVSGMKTSSRRRRLRPDRRPGPGCRRCDLEDSADDLGDSELAGTRLLKADAAGIEQQQYGAGYAPSSPVARGPQQTDELRPMDLAERAT